MRFSSHLVFLSLISFSSPLYALPTFLEDWRDKYPDSLSDDIGGGQDGGCQLCHQNSGGGNGWNSYGWDLRTAYRTNNFDFNLALDLVEFNDQDNDPAGATAFDEIELNRQPGWTAGAFNTVFFSNSDAELNQLPPPNLPTTTDYDLPAAINDPIVNPIIKGASIGLMELAGGFNAPVKAVTAPSIDDKIFVVEQTGKIMCVDLFSGEKTEFYDVSNSLVEINQNYDERGLLGLAFHPDFESNGLFYTYQSEPNRDTDVVDFSTLPSDVEPDHRSFVVEHFTTQISCDATPQKLSNVLIIDQPQSNHNGGDLVFDADANLYIALGDGGGGSDRGIGHGFNGNGRNNANVLGTILRINPLGNTSVNGNYSIPADNPFVGDTSAVDEIYAYGFRNPYRISFDADNGDLYAADVGQNNIEEINKVDLGGNYGWNWKEGSLFFYNPAGGNFLSDVAPPSLPDDLIDPVGQYDHDEGISITGGFVYRGSELPDLVGKYVFGDFSGPDFMSASGRLLYLDLQTQEINEFDLCPLSVPGYIFGFGEDANNELYVLTNDRFNPSGVEGKILKLSSPSTEENLPAQCREQQEICLPIRVASAGDEAKRFAVVCL